MITKMKKLTFLVYHKEYEAFLAQIRELGVVHVVERQCGEMDDTLQQFMQKRTLYKNMLQSMHTLADKQPEEKVHKELSADALVKFYEDLQARIQDLNQQIPAIDKDVAQMEVWGDFDWRAIRKLEDAGWFVQFYTCPEKDYNEAWAEVYNAIVVKENGGLLYFVPVTPQPVELDVEPLRLPSLSLSELSRKKADTEEALVQAHAGLKEFCKANYCTLEKYKLQHQEEIDKLKVKLNSEHMAEGAVVLMEGWIPEDCEADVRKLLDESGTYYEIRAAKREDNAPIKLKNNAYTRMYEVLTKMYGMPEYAEFDPTPILAPFFSLFFAFCMGDAGYGLVLIALGFILKRKMSKSMKGMMNLVITLCIFTSVIGAILGTFFGVSLFDLEIPAKLKEFMIVGKIGETTYDKQMLLALIIGAVHICIAMTVKAVGQTVRFGFKESLSAWGWLLLVVGFICTGGLSFFKIISEDVSTWAFIVIGGVSAIGIYL